MAVSAQIEQDGAADAFLLAAVRFADDGHDGMVRFGCRHDPFETGELDARRKALDLIHADRLDQPQLSRWLTSGAMPWYRSPPVWIAGGMNSLPSVCIFRSGVKCAVSPKS